MKIAFIGLGTAGATGHRRIGHCHALFGCRSRYITDGLRVDGAAIHRRHAFADAREHAVFIEPHAAYMGGGRQHGNHQFGALSGVTR